MNPVLEHTRDALLADGRVVQLRPIEPTDGERLVAFHDSLSPETNRLRFFAFRPHLNDRDVTRFTTVDHHDREAIIAMFGDELIGVARYDRVPETLDAEVAFVVSDGFQGTGVGSLLLEHLADRARAEGLERLIADTLVENRKMLKVFADSGLHATRTWDSGVAHLVMPLALSKEAVERIQSREHTSEAHSIERLLRPHSIAVIGASSREGTVGHEIVHSLIDAGFEGPVHPINPRGEAVEGRTAYRSIGEVPGDVDVAIVAIGADKVSSVVPECAAKGVHGLIVISGGFAETGAQGALLQRELATRVRSHGMRMIGPNCVGIVNTDDTVRVDASFGATTPLPGRVGLASQSGAVGIAVLDAATRSGIGISTFVSLGNKADVSGNDLLQYWEEDEQTDVILLYLESFGNAAKFARLARRIGRSKPIIAVKSGRTPAGRRAASSHTAAMAANDDAVDALLHHCGVVRVDTIDELLDAALVLAHQPVPRGRRIAIIGNSGGPGIMAADACGAAGLELATLSSATENELRTVMAAAGSAANPVDLLGDAGPMVYAQTIEATLADPAVDAAIVIHAPTLVADPDAIAAAIADVTTEKPVLAVLVGRDRGLLATGEHTGVPVFGAVEQAIAALGHATAYGQWRARPEDVEPERSDIDHAHATSVVSGVLAEVPDGRWLSARETADVLEAYGIPFVGTAEVADAEEAKDAARRFGYPVVLKAQGPDLVHKSDVGGVSLGLRSSRAVEHAWEKMRASLGASMTHGLVQHMASPGVELIAGIVRDDTFGPLVLFGIGGTIAELIGDRTVRVAPLSDADADAAVHSLRCAPLLTGYRGSEPVDVVALTDLLVRLGLMARDVPEVVELDLNPVIASPEQIVVVDARIRIRPAVADGSMLRQLAPPRPN